jgi:hypothetical protein
MVLAAWIAMCEVPMPLSKILLSFIPVRVVIQSSLVSTIFSKSALFKIFSGKKDPTAVIEALIFFKLVIYNFDQKWQKNDKKWQKMAKK